MPSEKKLEQAVAQVRNLIERLRSAPNKDDADADADQTGLIVFFQSPFGGLRLTGEEAKRYRESLEQLQVLHGGNPDLRTISRDEVERLLRRAILRSLGKADRTKEKRATFERRVKKELRLLRSGLLAAPKAWIVNTQVRGLGPAGLPFEFGAVTFVAGSMSFGNSVASELEEFAPKRRRAKKRMEAEREVRKRSREEISGLFTTHAGATVKVQAFDGGAARRLAVERVRLTVDVMNFFAPFFHGNHARYRAYVAPDGERTNLPWAVRPVEGDTFQWSDAWEDEAPVTKFAPQSARAQQVGARRASEILASDAPTDLESRIVKALSWAGRAAVEPRRDEALLLYAIALEALLTKPSSRSGVTDRLRLRVTRLLGLLPSTRKAVYDLMGHLYELRSDLVHSGSSTALSDDDLKSIRFLVNRALTGVLTDARFSKMRHAHEFERWFEDQMLA